MKQCYKITFLKHLNLMQFTVIQMGLASQYDGLPPSIYLQAQRQKDWATPANVTRNQRKRRLPLNLYGPHSIIPMLLCC